MILTERQLNILNHVVIDGQAWADNALKEEHILTKVAKNESAYDEAVAKGNYKNRKQRDDAEAKVKKDEYSDWEQQYLPSYSRGMLLVTTNQGVMSHHEAANKGLGGFLLGYVY